MTPFADLLAQGSAHAWLFIPSALLLGALHGLEPGHSKTMMAAFIVAVRGTVWQAILLGLSATLSHTAIVWAIALTGLYFGQFFDIEASEGWFQLASAVIILGVAAWMLFATWREQNAVHNEHDRDHEARSGKMPLSQAAGRAIARGLQKSPQADPEDRLLQLERSLRDHMRSTARDMQIVQELLIEVARAFFVRLPDAIVDEDPTVQAAVDRRIERLLDATAARIVAGRTERPVPDEGRAFGQAN